MTSFTVAFGLALLAVQASAPISPPQTQPLASQPVPQKAATDHPAPKPCAPNSDGRYNVWDLGMTSPKITHSVDPDLPRGADRLSGMVLVNFTVNAAGKTEDVHVVHRALVPTNPKILRDVQALEDSDIRAVEHYRFKPATCNGLAVPVEVNIEMKINPK